MCKSGLPIHVAGLLKCINIVYPEEYARKLHVGLFLTSQNMPSVRGMSPEVNRAGIFKQSMGARNRVGIELSYRPARLHRLAEFIPWNRFLGSINV